MDWVNSIECSIVLSRENAGKADAILLVANGRARDGRLSLEALLSGIRSVVERRGCDASVLSGRSWYVRPPLPAGVYNRKVRFTAAECRFEDGRFVLVRAGRLFLRANRMPPVSHVPDGLGFVRFVPLA